MRKLIIVLVLVIGFTGMYAQKGKVTSAATYLSNNEIDKAWEAIQEAEQNEKSANFDKTYYTKGKILQAMGESQDPNIKNMVEDPLIKAYEAYQKAIELDEKGKIQKSVDIMLPMLNNDFINLGVEKFGENDFEGAKKAFEYSLKVGESDIFGGIVDTSIVYNAGLAAYNGKMWNDAQKYFQTTMDMGYGGETVWRLQKEVYVAQGDSAAAEHLLIDGIDAFEDNNMIMVELINFYLTSNQDEKAFEYLRLAKEADPTNNSYWYVEGILYDKMGDLESAKASYKKAMELDPEYFEPYYNMGVIMFNEGVSLQDLANEIMDNKEYEIAKAKSDAAFDQALPYFEKAHELQPEDRSVLENLKVLYYRLQLLDKRDEVIRKLEALDQGGEQ